MAVDDLPNELKDQAKAAMRAASLREGLMVLRWVASGFLATEKNFRRLMGYTDLWILAAALDRHVDQEGLAA